LQNYIDLRSATVPPLCNNFAKSHKRYAYCGVGSREWASKLRCSSAHSRILRMTKKKKAKKIIKIKEEKEMFKPPAQTLQQLICHR